MQLDATAWVHYHVAEDYAENNNLAASEQVRLHAMINRWYGEAGKYKVLPIDGRGVERSLEQRPKICNERER
jgi:arylsulfatase